MENSTSCRIPITVKWTGKDYALENIFPESTIADLRKEIYKQTRVKPERQKLLNLRWKGKPVSDNSQISTLDLKPNFKIMMMGSLEEDIEGVNEVASDMPDIVNDLEAEDEEVSMEKQEIYLDKIASRVRKCHFKVLNEFRSGKKLLVLDIDYTLFDHKTTAQSGAELMRPYLHEFLTSAYQDYDIVIWSATNMKWIVEKMKILGVDRHPDYKIALYLDSSAMIAVQAERGAINVKPLGVIWGRYEQFSQKNTIMFDDISRNFLMNPRSGLKIKPFKRAHENRETDDELLKLAKYLKFITAYSDDFSTLNHQRWEKYVLRKEQRIQKRKDRNKYKTKSSSTQK